MKKEIKELADTYFEIEGKLFEKLSELEGANRECNCDYREIIKTVYEGSSFDEIMVTCLNCGGYVELD